MNKKKTVLQNTSETHKKKNPAAITQNIALIAGARQVSTLGFTLLRGAAAYVCEGEREATEMDSIMVGGEVLK